MSVIRYTVRFVAMWLILLGVGAVASGAERSLPPKMTAAILVKILEFEGSLNAQETMSIHVVGDKALARSLNDYVGKETKGSTIVSVTESNGIPESPVDILFVANSSNLDQLLEYSRNHKVMTVSNTRSAAESGVSLAIYDDEGMPGVVLNRNSSQDEGLSWKPEILEIASILR